MLNCVRQFFRMSAPIKTHRRPATCAEIQCKYHVEGWATIVAVNSPRALWIKHHSERRFIERVEAGGMVTFIFYPGQECFKTHSTTLERPMFLTHGKRTGELVHVRDPQQFHDTFNEQMHKAEQARKAGF